MKKFGIWLIMVVVYFVVLAKTVVLDNLSAAMIAIYYVFIPIVGIPLLIALKSSFSGQRNLRKEIENSLKKENFITNYEVTKDNGIRIDTTNNKICLIKYKYKFKSFSVNPSAGLEIKFIPYNKLLSSKIIIDTEILRKQKRNTFRKTTESIKYIKKLCLEIIVDDPNFPVHRINFLNESSRNAYDGFTGENAREEIRYWDSLLELIIAGQKIPTHQSVPELNDFVKMVKTKKAVQDGSVSHQVN